MVFLFDLSDSSSPWHASHRAAARHGAVRGAHWPQGGAFAATPLQWQQALAFVKRVGPKHGPVWKEAIRKFLPPGTSVNTLKTRFKTNNVGVSKTGVERWLPIEVEKKLHEWVLMQQRHNFCVTLASSLRWPPNLRGRSSSTRSRAAASG